MNYSSACASCFTHDDVAVQQYLLSFACLGQPFGSTWAGRTNIPQDYSSCEMAAASSATRHAARVCSTSLSLCDAEMYQ